MAETGAVTRVSRGPSAFIVKCTLSRSGGRGRRLTETAALVSGTSEEDPGPQGHRLLTRSDAYSMRKGHAPVCFRESVVTASHKLTQRDREGGVRVSTRLPPELIPAHAPAPHLGGHRVTCVVGHGRLVGVTLLLEDDVAKLKNPRDDPQQALGCNQRQLRTGQGVE